uniref:WepB n=1 Tax=Cronobacter turicensis TaxID=413502 RepID=I7E4Y9_9ENTR|nr:WepB [Cronobacter turicensis]
MNKAVVIHPLDDSYGATKILAYVIAALTRNYKIEVWYKSNKEFLERFLAAQNFTQENITYRLVPSIPVVHSQIFNIKGMLGLLKELVAFTFIVLKMKRSIGFVYINTYAAGLASFICKLCSVKNIIHCHENQKHKISGRALAYLIRKSADKIICVSKVVRNYVCGTSKNTPAVVIMNGITDIFSEVIDDKKIERHNPRFLIVGRIMPEKGYWFLADAIKRLNKDIGSITFSVDAYGDAPPNRPTLVDEYQEYLKSNKLDNDIKLLGFSQQADREMFNYDVVLVPSIMSDPFPTTVLEAMRAKCLVVTTSHGGAAEIITDGVNGILIQKDDTCMFARILRSIAQGDIDIASLASNARLYYEENLTQSAFEKNIVNCFDSFTKEHIDE